MRWHSIKKGVFGISKELQFRFSNNGKLYASPCTGRERELLWRGKGSWEGYSTLRLWLLLAELFPGKKRVFEREYHYNRKWPWCVYVFKCQRFSIQSPFREKQKLCLEPRIVGSSCFYLLATILCLRDKMSFEGNFLPLF